MNDDERLCECGHRRRWHSHGGAGDCEADMRRCMCLVFREYAPAPREADPRARRATIEVEQQPSGYWRGYVCVRMPGLTAPHEQGNNSFHNAGEALDWGRGIIELLARAAD